MYSIRTKAAAVGIVLGIIFALIQVSSSRRMSDESLAVAYAVILVLVIIVFVPSMKWGLVSGLIATLCEPLGEFIYYSVMYGTGIATGILPYSALSLPRLVVLPLSGLLGGAIAAEFTPKPEAAKKKGRQKEGRKIALESGD